MGPPFCNVCSKALPSGRPEEKGDLGGVGREPLWRLEPRGLARTGGKD